MVDCLVVGGISPIGQSLVSKLQEAGKSVAWTSRRRGYAGAMFLDLESLEGIDDLPVARCVALVAAETKFDACASDPDRTYRINVEAPVALARRALNHGSRVLFFSSIAVHNGMIDRPNENEMPSPNSVYGEQKREAELELLAMGGAVTILRPSKVITPNFGLFTEWHRLLEDNRAIDPFKDMFVAPISLDFVTNVAVALLGREDIRGVFQVSAVDQVSYADIAGWMADAVGADRALVQPTNARELNADMWLPQFARLGCARLTTELDLSPPNSLCAVEYFLRSRE